MCVDDGLRDRQAEPGARDRLVLRPLRAEEAIEQVSLRLRRDAHAGVGDLDANVAVALGGAEVDSAAGRRELQRVREEVVDHLSDAHRVARQAQVGVR